jgi:hypothetical protein
VSRWFTGRDDLLSRLGAGFVAGRSSLLTQTANGMGGVGKTTAAAAFSETHRHELDVVWWVRAETEATLIDDLAGLARRVGLPGGETAADGAAQARVWLELAENQRRWLVVFDNAPDEASIEPWRPKRGHGMVLITSRNRNFDRVGDVLDVGVFSQPVAEEFLRDRVADRNPTAAAEPGVGLVAERLGGLPLALEQAAAWVTRAPYRRFARYLGLFDDAAKEPFPPELQPLGYDATAFTTWRVSIDAATKGSPPRRADHDRPWLRRSRPASSPLSARRR